MVGIYRDIGVAEVDAKLRLVVVGVDQAEHIGMQCHVSTRQRRQRCLEAGQQGHQAIVGRTRERRCLFIEALARPAEDGMRANPNACRKNASPLPFDGREVVLALVQQSQVGPHQVDVRNAVVQRQ